MTYLVVEIVQYLLLATVLGVFVGTWYGKKKAAGVAGVDGDNVLDMRSRLERCHRENAELRRNLKDNQARLDRISRLNPIGENDELQNKFEAAQAKVSALLEDLQLRDDTIEALERELSEK